MALPDQSGAALFPASLSRIFRRALCLLALGALCAAAPAAAQQKAAPKIPPTPVTTMKAQAKNLPYSLSAMGRVRPSALVQVTPQVNGLVEKVHFQEGQQVEKGQLLFSMDPRPYQVAVEIAKASLNKDLAQLNEYRQELKRNLNMVKQKFVSQQDYEKIQAQALAQAAQVEADRASLKKAQLDLDNCQIKAPMAGRTGKLLINVGNQVAAGTGSVLVEIAALAPALADFSLPESELYKVRKYQERGELAVTATTSDHIKVTGKLKFIASQVDSQTGTIALRAAFHNHNRELWPGAFISVEVVLYVQEGVVVIPAQAAQEGPNGKLIYVVKDGQAQLRPITAGREVDGMLVVDKGVKAGEAVVVDGQGMLFPGASITEKSVPSLRDSLKTQQKAAAGSGPAR